MISSAKMSKMNLQSKPPEFLYLIGLFNLGVIKETNEHCRKGSLYCGAGLFFKSRLQDPDKYCTDSRWKPHQLSLASCVNFADILGVLSKEDNLLMSEKL